MREGDENIMQLIFVEGVSGVGKTTMVWKLCEKLRDNGFFANCFLEFDFANPIDFYCTAYFSQDEYVDLLDNHNEFADDIQNNTIVADDIRLVRYCNWETPLFPEPLLGVFRKHEFCWKPSNLVPISEFTRVYKSVWEQFVQKESKSPDYLLFDGSLFHHPINDMTRNYSASLDQIIHHINTLIEAVNQLRPRVIYLSSKNVDVLHAAYDDTGIGRVPHHLKLDLLPPGDALFHQHLVDTGSGEPDLDDPPHLVRRVRNAAA